MNSNLMILPLAVIQSALLAAGQVFLKFALGRMLPFSWTSAFWKSVFVNWQFAACGLCYGAASLLWFYIVKHFPLSSAYPMVSLSFVFGMFAAMIFFHEPVGLAKWLGVLLIIVGCYFIAK
ncbi:MAG: EamA family transporter [Bacteroidales bacterium]|nr:EamA family transporter [Bacteroidales bacterium]